MFNLHTRWTRNSQKYKIRIQETRSSHNHRDTRLYGRIQGGKALAKRYALSCFRKEPVEAARHTSLGRSLHIVCDITSTYCIPSKVCYWLGHFHKSDQKGRTMSRKRIYCTLEYRIKCRLVDKYFVVRQNHKWPLTCTTGCLHYKSRKKTLTQVGNLTSVKLNIVHQ